MSCPITRLDEMLVHLGHVWDTKKMDWLGMESTLVDILKLDVANDLKLKLVKECIDAYTRRGHFVHE